MTFYITSHQRWYKVMTLLWRRVPAGIRIIHLYSTETLYRCATLQWFVTFSFSWDVVIFYYHSSFSLEMSHVRSNYFYVLVESSQNPIIMIKYILQSQTTISYNFYSSGIVPLMTQDRCAPWLRFSRSSGLNPLFELDSPTVWLKQDSLTKFRVCRSCAW